MEYISNSEKDTLELAERIAATCVGNEIIVLDGDLGAGKTTFTKGFAKAIGIKRTVTSPTFTLMKSYADGKFPLYHFDLYRITDEAEVEELGFSDYLGSDGICLIEWNKFSNLKGNIIEIHFDYLSETTRKITVERGENKS